MQRWIFGTSMDIDTSHQLRDISIAFCVNDEYMVGRRAYITIFRRNIY